MVNLEIGKYYRTDDNKKAYVAGIMPDKRFYGWVKSSNGMLPGVFLGICLTYLMAEYKRAVKD